MDVEGGRIWVEDFWIYAQIAHKEESFIMWVVLNADVGALPGVDQLKLLCSYYIE